MGLVCVRVAPQSSPPPLMKRVEQPSVTREVSGTYVTLTMGYKRSRYIILKDTNRDPIQPYTPGTL